MGATIAAQIRAYRTKRGWSVRQLAEECAKHGARQLTEASLGNIERGQDPNAKRKSRDVSVEELLILAYVLNAKPAELMFDASAERVEVTPTVAAHPFVAWSWLTGSAPLMATDFDWTEVWGRPLRTKEEMGQPNIFHSWESVDNVLYGAVLTYQLLAELRRDGAETKEAEKGYAKVVRQLGLLIDDFVRSWSVRDLPTLPSWIVEDLTKMQAEDLIKMKNASDSERHPRADSDGWIRARLPRDLPTYESERPQ